MSDRAVEKHIGSVFQKLGLVDEHEVNRRVMAVLAYLEAAAPAADRRGRGHGVRPTPPPGFGWPSRAAGSRRTLHHETSPRARPRQSWRAHGWWSCSAWPASWSGVYVVVVLGGGALIGHTDSPSLPLSVTGDRGRGAVVRARAGRPGTGRDQDGVPARLPTPYDVLSRFSDDASRGDYATEELPARMAMLLAQGTGAQWAQVWLIVSGRLTLAATWPARRRRWPTPARRCDPVAVDATATAGGPWPCGTAASCWACSACRSARAWPLTVGGGAAVRRAGRPGRAGAAAGRAAGRARGPARSELMVRAEELKASRERLIETQDAERRRLERDMHDGAQQHLVALAVNLRLAQTIAARSRNAPRACSPSRPTRRRWRSRRCRRCPAGSTRGCWPTKVWCRRCGPRVAASAIPVTVDGRRAWDDSRPRSRPRCTSAAWRRSRTPPKHSGAAAVTVRLGEDRDTLAAHRHRRRHRLRPGSTRGRRRRRRPGQHARPAGRGRWHRGRRVAVGLGPRSPPWYRGPTMPRQLAAIPVPARRSDVHARIAWAVVGLTALAAILDTVFTAAHRSAAERGDVGGPRLAAGPAGQCGLRADGRADRLALPEAPAGLAAVRRQPARR